MVECVLRKGFYWFCSINTPFQVFQVFQVRCFFIISSTLVHFVPDLYKEGVSNVQYTLTGDDVSLRKSETAWNRGLLLGVGVETT